MLPYRGPLVLSRKKVKVVASIGNKGSSFEDVVVSLKFNSSSRNLPFLLEYIAGFEKSFRKRWGIPPLPGYQDVPMLSCNDWRIVFDSQVPSFVLFNKRSGAAALFDSCGMIQTE
jgi:hypothetical protein